MLPGCYRSKAKYRVVYLYPQWWLALGRIIPRSDQSKPSICLCWLEQCLDCIHLDTIMWLLIENHLAFSHSFKVNPCFVLYLSSTHWLCCCSYGKLSLIASAASGDLPFGHSWSMHAVSPLKNYLLRAIYCKCMYVNFVRTYCQCSGCLQGYIDCPLLSIPIFHTLCTYIDLRYQHALVEWVMHSENLIIWVVAFSVHSMTSKSHGHQLDRL